MTQFRSSRYRRARARRGARQPGARAEEIRHRRYRHRDQDRPDDSADRPGFRLWRHRQGAGRLYPDDQRAGRRQRPQDQPHPVRRRLQSAEDRRTGAQAGRKRRGAADLPDHRHAAERRRAEIPQRQEGPATARLDRRDALHRSEEFPWTIAFNPNYQSEAHIYAKYILANYPNAKIAILYQNDDLGKDYVKGLKDALGAKAAA